MKVRLEIIVVRAGLYLIINASVNFVFQTDEPEVINFLLTTEIIPLCLRIMESGSELSKTVRVPLS